MPSPSEHARFAWKTAFLFSLGIVIVLALNICQQHRLIDPQVEAVLRLLVNGSLATIMLVIVGATRVSRTLRYVIVFSISCAMVETVFNFTEDVVALNNVAVVGRNSVIRPTLESIVSAGWMAGAFCIACLAISYLSRSNNELEFAVEEMRESEMKLRAANAELQSTLVELQVTQRQLVSQERLSALGQMTSGIVHELSNTLTPIVSYSTLLGDATRIGKQELDWIQAIDRAANDMAEIIGGLQQFYRQDAQLGVGEQIQLGQLVEQVVLSTKPRWKDEVERSGGAIEIEQSRTGNPSVVGNPHELRMVLTNLVFNAIDAMPDGGLLCIESDVVADMARLRVTDDGAGMDAEAVQRCFEPFYTTKDTGTGLGLSVCHGIIGRHGGRIECSSDNSGTSFTIYLPLATQTQAKVEPRVRRSDELGDKPNVLLIDDDASVRASLAALMKAMGWTLEVAEGGRDGIDSFRQQPGGHYDWVITDLGMAGVDGTVVVQEIRTIWPDQRIAVVSGWSEDDVLSRFTPDLMPDLVLSKPVGIKKLKSLLQQDPAPLEHEA